MPTLFLTVRAIAILAVALVSPSALAIDYTWSSATTGGLWSGTANWSPNSATGGPTTADAVFLDSTASDTTRTVTVDAAASGTVATITMTQTNSGTNTLEIARSTFRVTGALTMTSGSLAIFNTSTGTGATSNDRRLRVGGNLSITGGTVSAQNATNGGLYLDGATTADGSPVQQR